VHAAGVAAARGGGSGAGALRALCYIYAWHPCAWRWPACGVLHLPPHTARCRATRGNSKTFIRKIRFRCENHVSHTPNFSPHVVEDIRDREGLLRAILRKRLRCVCGLLERAGESTSGSVQLTRLSHPVSLAGRWFESAAAAATWTALRRGKCGRASQNKQEDGG
jgi:hypothetical protein